MRRIFLPVITLALVAIMMIATSAAADSSSITFESGYTLGNIDGQSRWSKTGAYDAEVADPALIPNASGFGFGTRALRISNEVTSGSFGDQTIAPSLAEAAGETGKNHFEASFDFGSTLVDSADRPRRSASAPTTAWAGA